MSTSRLFEHDAYRTDFDAVVLSCTSSAIVLDATCFYAESGGQPGDTGLLQESRITDTTYSEAGGTVLHHTDQADRFSEGQRVSGKIDWERRFRLMKLHSALHIAYLVFETTHGKHPLKGSNVGEDRARVDYAFTAPLDISSVTDGVQAIIDASMPIDRAQDGDTSTWAIEGYEPIPCGGTHPRHTGEIGEVACKVKRLGKRGQRIYVSLAGGG
jgi:alanyl-tRNA synthetase